MFRDDAIGSDVTTEVNANNDPAVRNIPTLRKLTVTNFPVGSEGLTFRFKVTALNKEGATDSGYTSIVLAGPPDAPLSPPILDTDLTSDTQITVNLPLIPDANNGNSPIISYNMEMDDGLGGEWITVGGLETYSLTTSYTIVSGINRGRTYRFRYRTSNSAGWSGYSDILYA